VLEARIKEQFREAMRGVTSTVFLLTTKARDGNAGMTATAVCSLSFDPVSVLVCVNRTTAFMSAVETCGRFAVNVLSLEDEAVAKAFGSTAAREQRFTRGDWYGLEGLPALRSSLSAISCKVAGHMDFGSHRIIVGEVSQVDIRKGRAELLYCEGEYRSLLPRLRRKTRRGEGCGQ
jgi:flavin reductase